MPSAPTAGTHVWYACYGSNLHRDRFLAYLQGGAPPGAARSYAGSVDPSPPVADRAVRFPGSVYFALESKAWTGGTAFLDYGAGAEERADVPAYGRAYLVTARQFEDVVAQENHREHRPIDLAGLALGQERALGPGRYETLLCTGHASGVPVVTVTCPWSLPEAVTTVPSAAYLRMLAAGLEQAHGLPLADAAAYLASRPGARGSWTAPGLLAALTSAA